MADQGKVSFLLQLVDKISEPIQGIRKKLDDFGSSVSSLGKTIAGFVTAAAFGALLKKSTDEAGESEQSIVRLEQALKNVGVSYQQVGPEAEKYLDHLQKTTRFSDEDAREALTKLVTITGDYRGSLGNLNLVADVAAYKHIAMADAAEIVGKAQMGNTKVLREFGITAKDGADGIEQLGKKMKGQAEVDGKTWQGSLERINNLWGENLEKVGNAIIKNDKVGEALTGVTGFLANMAVWVENNSGAIGSFIDGLTTLLGWLKSLASFIAGAVIGTLNSWAHAWEDLKFTASRSVIAIRQAIGSLVKGIGDLVSTSMAKSGAQMRSQADEDLRELKILHEEKLKSIYGVVKKHEEDVVKTTTDGANHRTGIVKEHADKRLMIERDSAEKLNDSLLALYKHIDTEYEKFLAAQAAKKKASADAFKAQLDEAIAKAQEVGKELLKAIPPETETNWKKIALQGVGIARGLIDAAQGAGLLGANMASALTSALNLAEAVAKIAGGDIAGGLSQGIGALINLGKTIFGASDGLKAAINRNIATLEQHRRALIDLTQSQLPGRSIAGVQAALAAALKVADDLHKKHFDLSAADGAKVVGQALLDQGLTIKDLEEVAKTFGIEIRDKDGNLRKDLLRQLLDDLNHATTAPQTYASARAALDSDIAIGQGGDEGARLAGIGAKYSPAVAKALAGIDLSSSTGRAKAISRLQALGTSLNSNALTPGDIGMSVPEFRQFLADLFGILSGAGGTDITTPGGNQPPINLAASLGTFPANEAGLAGTSRGGVTNVEAGGTNTTIYLNGPFNLTVETMASEPEAVAKAVSTELGRVLQQDRAALGSAARAA